MNRVGLAVAAAFVLSPGATAQAAESAATILDKARAQCESFENGELRTTVDTVSLADLTGDGRPEEIVDSSQLGCSSSATLFCGTGGCYLTAIVDGKASEFLAKAWRVVKWDAQPILLLAVHGSECGGTKLMRCDLALVWSKGAFRCARQGPSRALRSI